MNAGRGEDLMSCCNLPTTGLAVQLQRQLTNIKYMNLHSRDGSIDKFKLKYKKGYNKYTVNLLCMSRMYLHMYENLSHVQNSSFKNG